MRTADPTTLLLFAAIVRTGSFSAGARSMGLVKSSASKRVAALEDHLGVKLLRRTTRKVVPTSEGLHVYEAARRVAEAFATAERMLDRAASGDAGTIRMSAPVTLAHMFLAPMLKSFLDAHPEVTIDLVEVLARRRRGEFGLYAVHADGAKLARRVRRLVDHLVAAFASPRWMEQRP